MLKEALVELSHVFRCSAVYKHRVENVHVEHVAPQFLGRAWLRILQQLAVVVEVYAVAVEDGIL